MIIWRKRIACWILKATNADTGCVILIVFHCNNGCTNAPQCYVIGTLSALFYYEVTQQNNTTSTVRIKAILGCDRITIVAVEKK
jgi:hypothetical protein